MHRNKFKKFRMRNKPNITQSNISKRLIFANKYKDWNYRDWSRIIYSDECSVEFGQKYKKMVWRPPGESMKKGMYEKSNQVFVKKYVKVWSCFGFKGCGELVFVNKPWNGAEYKRPNTKN